MNSRIQADTHFHCFSTTHIIVLGRISC